MWILIRPICDRFGMDPDHQVKRMTTLGIPTQLIPVGPSRARALLAVDVYLWIASISSRPTRFAKTFASWRAQCIQALRTLAHQAAGSDRQRHL